MTDIEQEGKRTALLLDAILTLGDHLSSAEAERDEWKGQVVCIRGQQRDALTRAEKAEAENASLRERLAKVEAWRVEIEGDH